MQYTIAPHRDIFFCNSYEKLLLHIKLHSCVIHNKTFYLRIGAADSWITRSKSRNFERSQDDVTRNQDSICEILSGLAPRCHTVERSSFQLGLSARPKRVPLRGYSWTPLMQSTASLWSAIKSFHNPSQGLSTPRVLNPELSANPPRASNFHDTISGLFPSSFPRLPFAFLGVIFWQLKLQSWCSLKSCLKSGAVDYSCDFAASRDKFSLTYLEISK